MTKKTDTALDRSAPPQANASAALTADAARTDIVGLVASAGGLDAISAVLRALPPDFSAAIVVAQHLGGQGSMLVPVLQRRISLPIDWARDGEPVRTGHVTVCPPRSTIEVLPDRTCAVRKLEHISDYPLDTFLASLAHSFGASAVGVVLTGMGRDGAKGAAALKRAGGTVIAQSEDTAEQPSMPRAAIAAGVDLVLPLHEIATVLREVVSGARPPRPRTETEAAAALFAGSGDARAELRAIDWSATALGPVSAWPAQRRDLVRFVLASPLPISLAIGPDQIQIANDANVARAPDKQMQGLPARMSWSENWDTIMPFIERLLTTGEPWLFEDALIEPLRHGRRAEAYFTGSFIPVYEAGAVAGWMNVSVETTERVLAQRRLTVLHALAGAGGNGRHEAVQRLAAALGDDPHDVPFALLYLVDAKPARNASLVAATGIAEGSGAAPRTITLSGGHPAWPVAQVVADGKPALVEDLRTRFRGLHAGPWPETTEAALVLPLAHGVDNHPAGVLIAGLSARLPFDTLYRSFLELAAAQVASELAAASARDRERERRDRLAELDRAKIEFFSNVSHEFRTPLTLLLAPLEELLRRRDDLPAQMAAEVEVAARNSRRLLALVNTLLDFSQIEAGRLHARFEATDLSELTTDIASAFTGAVERTGLRFIVDCPELPERVWVDRAMWEKIVSNFLANAIKFTFDGEIELRLRALPKHAELVVRDTGVGIPPEEQSQIFKRFHRVRASRARSHDGAGIGLALVSELVRVHHGRVRVQSEPGNGSTFTVWIPLGKRIVDEAAPEAVPASTGVAETLAEEAAAWAGPAAERTPDGVLPEALGAPKNVEGIARGAGASVLVAEDNADMRDYLYRLMSPYWRVELAVDGEDALQRARLTRPDLILADVMMPKLDGFGLLSAVRADETLRRTSVILVTARAGEEAAIQGLLAGADDYVAKPFSTRELIARVGGQLELSRMRRRAAELNEFLVRFSDASRAVMSERTVALTACRMLAEQLGLERSYWAELDWTTREFVVEAEMHADGVAEVGGRFPLDEWDFHAASYLAGRPVISDDTQADPRLAPAVKERLARLGIIADIGIPVMTEGRLWGVLAGSHRTAYHWTVEEIQLVEALAGRAWAEIERARAEAALRERGARFRALATAGADALYRMSPDWSEMWELDGRGFLSDTPLPSETWLTRYIHPEDRQPVLDAIAEAIREKRTFELPHRVVRADGSLGWVHSRAVPLFDAAGAITEWIGAGIDVTARTEAEAALRASEERQTFLLTLSDALRTIFDPADIRRRAMELLGTHLGFTRIYFFDVERDDDSWAHVIERGYQADPDQVEFIGRYPLKDFGSWMFEGFERGDPVCVSDIETLPGLTAEQRANYRAVGVAAFINVPLLRGGEYTAGIGAHDGVPHTWTRAEIDLIREVAARTWAAVEAVRAEAALRESEAKFRTLFESMD